VRWRDGRIEIEPATAPVKLVRRGRFLVAVPEAEIEPLTVESVEATRQALGLRHQRPKAGRTHR
jgi:hypothetical protein